MGFKYAKIAFAAGALHPSPHPVRELTAFLQTLYVAAGRKRERKEARKIEGMGEQKMKGRTKAMRGKGRDVKKSRTYDAIEFHELK